MLAGDLPGLHFSGSLKDAVRSLLIHTAHPMNVRGRDELVEPVAARSQLLRPKSTDQPPRATPASVH